MAWIAHLNLAYALAGERSVVHFEHDGPLRVLHSLYPEGDAVCHNVLVHPPGGLVAGDQIHIRVNVAPGAHGLVSSPGAARFYRSRGEPVQQHVTLDVAAGGRLEWLPLETIAYNGCDARNHLTLRLAEGAQALVWDVTALGLPGAGEPFDQGRLHQRMSWPGHWLEEAWIEANDPLLLNSPTGLAGHRCMGTFVLASGTALPGAGREALLQALRDAAQPYEADVLAGITSPSPHLVVVRALAPMSEPVSRLFRRLWQIFRHHAWQMPNTPPRIWSV